MHYIKVDVCQFNDAYYRGYNDKSDPMEERPYTIPPKYTSKLEHLGGRMEE